MIQLSIGSNSGPVAGLSEAWFWTDEFQIPQIMNWSDTHAEEVETFYRESGLSQVEVAKHLRREPIWFRRPTCLLLARQSADRNLGIARQKIRGLIDG